MQYGYKLLKLTPDDRTTVLACIQNDKVDYTALKQFIDRSVLPLLEQKAGFESPMYLKCRISNNNNSVDAAVFHSDVYNFTDGPMPLYTAVCYLDKAELEIIPGSHTNPRPPYSELTPKVLHLEAGDVVLFNAALLHRGVNFSRGKNRRVLQVFDIFPSPDIYRDEIKKFKTVDRSKGKHTQTNLLYYIAQHKWLVDIVNAVILFLVYHNIQYVVAGVDLPPWEKKGYISYEPSGRVKYRGGLTGALNLNVIMIPSRTTKDSYFYASIYAFIVLAGVFVWVRKQKSCCKK